MTYFETLIQNGLTYIWDIIRRSAPAKFKTGMCEMKILGLRFCDLFWDIDSKWVDIHMGYNMEICSGKVQNRDVRDENLGV